MKTNKSFSKRLKVTRRGKIVARKPGKNHFNAKEGRSKQMSNNRTQHISEYTFTPKVLQRYIGNPSKQK
ncbi:50S ribosomal protein L35 [Candidatus Kaiserbacteria bacterium]|nr:50S ribosomal protein L35 [Candidatus Kaiserbacteria bacterium]